MKVVYWWKFLLMKVRIVIFWPSDCFVARKYCNNLLINKKFVVIEIIKGFQSTTKTGGCRGRIWRLWIEYEGCLCIWRLSSPVYVLLCPSFEIHHLGMVQRRLKSEVWLRDIWTNEYRSQKIARYSLASMYPVTFCLAQNCFTFFFLKFRLNIILFERMNNMEDFEGLTFTRIKPEEYEKITDLINAAYM